MTAAGLRAAALLALALWIAPPAPAATEAEGWSYDLAHELMSPYCPGRTLAECPSEKADTLRMWLHVQEASGRPVDEVTAELVERFGDGILSAPRPEGFGLMAYIVPVLAFVAGGAVWWIFVRRQTREAREVATVARPAAAAPAGPSDAELERLVDDELSR